MVVVKSLMEIPIIDISPFLQDPTTEASKAVIHEVQRACTTHGFLQIVGHGIEPELQDAVLEGCIQFFNLPIEEKRKLDRSLPGSCGRGYEVMRSHQRQGLGGDFKEGFYAGTDVPRDHPAAQSHPGFLGPNKWVPEDILPRSSFRDPVETYTARMNELARIMLRILAAGLPYGLHVFDDFLDGIPMSLFSAKHYPPSEEHVHEEGEHPSIALGCGPHADFGSITLLLQDMVGGLQVKCGEDQWIDVVPNRDAYVVNIGDLIQKWTRGKYQSTVHRVLAPREKVHRYSLPFFFNGNLDTRLVPFDQMADGASGEEGETVQEYLLERVKKTMLEKAPVGV